MRQLFILFLTIAIGSYGQEVIRLNDRGLGNELSNYVPIREIEETNDGIIVTYTFNQVKVVDDELYETTKNLIFDGFGTNENITEPSLPKRGDLFTISEDAIVSVVDSSYIEIPLVLAPAKPMLVDTTGACYSKENVPEIAPYVGFFPLRTVDKADCSAYRGGRLMRICVTPVQYDLSRHIARIYNKIQYKVTNVKKGYERNPVIRNIVLNGKKDINRNISNSIPQKIDYLIISVPEYVEAVERMATWKRIQGFNVHVLYKDYWPSDSIRERVRAVYNSTDSLAHLLIVGDQVNVQGTKRYDYYTDYYYSCVDGPNDASSDISYGRLSVSTANEANIVVNKIIKYEQTPLLDSQFYQRGLNCAYFEDANNDSMDDRRFSLTCEEVRNGLVSLGKSINRVYYTESNKNPLRWSNTWANGDSVPYELRKPIFPWDGNYTDIQNSINEGTFFVLHRDHGNETSWSKPFFNKSHISALTNGDKLPIVFSINCSTGQFYYPTCFAEQFLRKENGGCVAIFAASHVSYSGNNDVLTKGMFDAIWPEANIPIPLKYNILPTTPSTNTPIYELGLILEQGMNRMSEYCDNRVLYTREIFHCFGDPSMEMPTEMPTGFTDIHLNSNSNGITVSLPETAYISLYDSISNNVSLFWGNSAYFPGVYENAVICIREHNKIPYVVNVSTGMLYLQDKTITTDSNYLGAQIKVGSNVTNAFPSGSVSITGGKTTLIGQEIVIEGETTVENGAELEIRNE